MRKGIPFSDCCIADKLDALEKQIKSQKTIGFVTVSPIGRNDGCKLSNNGCDYGPDTPGTVTSGINEAILSLKATIEDALESNVSISDGTVGGTVRLMPGLFLLKDTIVLSQGITIEGNGRLSSLIRLAAKDFNTSMNAMIKIPANANECCIKDMSIIGRRDTAYQSYSIDGIRLDGYSWRATLENLEIVNCQGNGIGMYSSDNAENSINFEPILLNISVISCMYGMTLTYCADEALMAINIENCDEGLRYYGGNGKWFDVHIFDCPLGCRISGAPLRTVDMTLDTNTKPMIIENIDDSISPGLVQLISPIFVDNSGPLEIKSEHVRLLNPDFIVKKIASNGDITSAVDYEISSPIDGIKLNGTEPTYLTNRNRIQTFTNTYNTNVSFRKKFRIQIIIDEIMAADEELSKTGATGWYAILKKYFIYDSSTTYKIQVYLDSNETILGMNLTDSSGNEVSGKSVTIMIFD